jgi:hypothetical protein
VVDDVDTEVGEGVGEALHLLTVVIDTEVALNEAPKGGVEVEDVGFAVAEEVVCWQSKNAYIYHQDAYIPLKIKKIDAYY